MTSTLSDTKAANSDKTSGSPSDDNTLSLGDFVARLSETVATKGWSDWLVYEPLVPIRLQDGTVLLQGKESSVSRSLTEREQRRNAAHCVIKIPNANDYCIVPDDKSDSMVTIMTDAAAKNRPLRLSNKIDSVLDMVHEMKTGIVVQTTEIIRATWCIAPISHWLMIRADFYTVAPAPDPPYAPTASAHASTSTSACPSV